MNGAPRVTSSDRKPTRAEHGCSLQDPASWRAGARRLVVIVSSSRTHGSFVFLQQTPRCSLVGPPFVRRDDTSTGQTVLHSSSPSRSASALAVSLPRVRFGTRPAEASARTIYSRCNACARASPRTQGIRLTGVASRAVASLLAARGQMERRRRPPGKPPQEILTTRTRVHGRGDDPGRPDADGSACPVPTPGI